MEIDPNEKISKYFTYKEALWLPSWDRMATEEDGLTEEIVENLKVLFAKLDIVRDHFQKPIVVHVAYRPPEYNALVGGAKSSAHMQGMACDFHLKDVTCSEARNEILHNGLLESLELRMENIQGNWVHLDTKEVAPGRGRFFYP